MSTTVSNYQLPLLKAFRSVAYMNIEKAMTYDQRAFRSFLIRGWIAFKPGQGFHLTRAGDEAWELLHHTEIKRHDPTRPLTRYFDYVAYGFRDPRLPKPRLHVVRHTAA